MKFNIVIYGCDNTGKTTLANNLAKHFNSNGIHTYITKSLGPAGPFEQIAFMSSKLVATDSSEDLEVQIFDRFPAIEEKVCGNVLRGCSTLDRYPGIDSHCLSKVDFFILCDPGIEAINNWGTREQMEGIKENATKLWEQYKTIPSYFGLENRTLFYNYTNMSFLDVASPIMFYIMYAYENHSRKSQEAKNEHN